MCLCLKSEQYLHEKPTKHSLPTQNRLLECAAHMVSNQDISVNSVKHSIKLKPKWMQTLFNKLSKKDQKTTQPDTRKCKKTWIFHGNSTM